MDIQEIAAEICSSNALREAAAKAGIEPDQTQAALQAIMEHVANGSPAGVTPSDVAANAGLTAAQIQAFLPSVLGLLSGHAQNANEGVQAVLGGLIGSLQNVQPGSLLYGLDANKDGSVVDDAIGLVAGLFGGKKS